MKRRPIRPMSARRRAELDARKRTRQQVLDRDGHTCQFRRYWRTFIDAEGGYNLIRGEDLPPARCTDWLLEVHELLSRARGGNWLEPHNCVTLCHAHHQWVTEHPAAATRIGLLHSAPYRPPTS